MDLGRRTVDDGLTFGCDGCGRCGTDDAANARLDGSDIRVGADTGRVGAFLI